MKSFLILCISITLLSAGCVTKKHKKEVEQETTKEENTGTTDPADQKVVAATKNKNGDYVLGEGMPTVLGDNDFTMVVNLVQDNRCPPRVNCFQAGELTVEVLLKGDNKEEKVTLTYPIKQGSTNTTLFNGTRINFVGGTPAFKYASPDSDDKIMVAREFYFSVDSKDPNPKTGNISFPINKRFSLRQAEVGALEKEPFTVEVVSIRDSRCPPGVNCIRAGEVEVDVILKSGAKEEKKTLTYPTKEKRGSTNTTVFDGKSINFFGASAKKSPGASKPSIPKQFANGLELYFEVKPVIAKE